MKRINEGNSIMREVPATGERQWYITTLDEMPEPWSHDEFVIFFVRLCGAAAEI